MNDVDVLMEFLRFPLDDTVEIFAKFAGIPRAIHRGSGLEQFVFIEGRRDNRVLLVAHADTYWDHHYGRNWNRSPQDVYQENGVIRNRNGGLGADDRAGCAMLYLLQNLGHSILVTSGEEKSLLGSKWLMRSNSDIADTINFNHQFAVQLDRRYSHDFKCYFVGTDEFRDYIRQTTGYTEPNRLKSTDIVVLCRDICGVNLSVGYYNEHKKDEHLVISEWQNTLNLCREWLSQQRLPSFSR